MRKKRKRDKKRKKRKRKKKKRKKEGEEKKDNETRSARCGRKIDFPVTSSGLPVFETLVKTDLSAFASRIRVW